MPPLYTRNQKITVKSNLLTFEKTEELPFELSPVKDNFLVLDSIDSLVVGYVFDKSDVLLDKFCFECVPMTIEAYRIAKNGRFLVIGNINNEI